MHVYNLEVKNQPNWFGWNLLPQISGVNIRSIGATAASIPESRLPQIG
jgi:hypothetical protein